MDTARTRVLIVEDLPSDAELAEREITKALGACAFRRVETREEYLEALATFAPEIIVSDFQLPHFDGMSALALARERLPDVPFIVVTGSMNEDTAVDCMKAGAADYVIKEHIKRLGAAVLGAREHQRARLQHGVVDAERVRLATAISQIAEAVVITDAKGAIQYVNPAFEATTGYSRTEALGKNPRILKSGLQSPAFYEALWGTISKGKTWRGRFVNARKNGSHLVEEATISPVRNAAGEISEYVAVKRDITRELDLEAQVFTAQRMESVGRLAGGIAHDFNNIIAVILAFTGFALKDLPAGAPSRDDLREVEKAAQRAALLTRQLLAFSRKQILQPEPIDLNQSVAQLEPMLRRVIGEDIDLAHAFAPGLGTITADPSQLDQVLMNLVVNARDAMPAGGKLSIETANVELDEAYAAHHLDVKPGPWVRLAVTDTGTGMDEATRARLFEPFFTTKEKGKGTGLGLSTVYGIVKQSGGHIGVHTAPGRGTTFELLFPRVAPAPMAERRSPAPIVRALGTETVLVVEDDDGVRSLTRRILEDAGYAVLTAADGAAAIALCETGAAPDLVVTDVVMPLMSGKELARRLVGLRPGLKVLFMSGYAGDAISDRGVLEPGTNFIAKPFDVIDFARKVREVLDSTPA